MRKEAPKTADADTLAAAIAASADDLLPTEAGSDDILVAIEKRLQRAADAYTRIEGQLKDDNSEAANRKCAAAWQTCEDIVAEIAAHKAESLTGLQIKVHALSWTASTVRDDLRKSIADDLLGLGSSEPSPVMPRRCLESALTDATQFGRLAYRAFCNIGLEKLDPPVLDRDDNALVYWTISELSGMIEAANEAFHEEHARKQTAS